jgi:hypothetical protein
MAIAEQIYELAKSLPPEQAEEALTFMQDLKARRLETAPVVDAGWSHLVESLAGTWGDDFPALEDIRANPGRDIPRARF